MPIYEYRCEECGEKFEKLVASFRLAAEADCPKCGSTKVKKIISSFSARGSSASKSSYSSCAPSSGGG